MHKYNLQAQAHLRFSTEIAVYLRNGTRYRPMVAIRNFNRKSYVAERSV